MKNIWLFCTALFYFFCDGAQAACDIQYGRGGRVAVVRGCDTQSIDVHGRTIIHSTPRDSELSSPFLLYALNSSGQAYTWKAIGGLGNMNKLYMPLEFIPNLTKSTKTYNGQTVYELDSQGYLGITISLSEQSSSLTAVSSNKSVSQQVYNGGSGHTGSVSYRAVFNVVLLKIPASGSVSARNIKIGTMQLPSSLKNGLNQTVNVEKRSGFDFKIDVIEVTFRIATCTLASQRNQTVTLKTVLASEIMAAGGSGVSGGSFNLEFNCPNKTNGVNVNQVNGVMTDMTTPSNTSRILTLAQSNQGASNVGLSLYQEGNSTAVQFGPPQLGNHKITFAHPAANQNTKVSSKFDVRYVQQGSGKVTGGEVKGVVQYTVFYQ